jgi:ribosomal protein L11 methyltransferase
MIELFPQGFEERDESDGVELAAYTDAGGEERLWHVFGAVRGRDVDEGWEERWRLFHRPVRVGRFWVGPPWETPDRDTVAIVVDPGRAFGTGAHPTTRLCLELLVELEPSSIVDVGCGSGVLSIAAAKLGFDPVVAVDVDPQAVDATERNAAANGVAIDARLADATSESLPRADVAIANIALAAVEVVIPRAGARRAITSGYLASDAPTIASMRTEARREADGWAAELHVADDSSSS